MFTGFASVNTPAIQIWDFTVTAANVFNALGSVSLQDDCAPIQFFKTGGNSTSISVYLPSAPIEGKQIKIINSKYGNNSCTISIFSSDVSGGGTSFSSSIAILSPGTTLDFCYSKNFISFGAGSGSRATGWITLNQSPAGSANSYAVAVGGSSNNAAAANSFIGGGTQNTANGNSSFVAGGSTNIASGYDAFVFGSGNTSSGGTGSIAGGQGCTASGARSIALGYNCTASGGGYGSIAIGGPNTISSSYYGATAIGPNNTASADFSTAIGYNVISSNHSASSLGGAYNTNTGFSCTLSGGILNTSTSASAVATGNGVTAGTADSTLGLNSVSGTILPGLSVYQSTGYLPYPKGIVASVTAAGTTFATTATSGTSTAVTIAHAGGTYAVGSFVTIAGVTPSGYNGTYKVTASSSGSVTFADTTTGVQTVAGTIRQAITVVMSGATWGVGVNSKSSVSVSFVKGNSYIGGGNQNSVTGTISTIVGGSLNTANGDLSSILGGSYGNTRSITGYTVFPASNSPIANATGVSQSGLLILGAQTTDATATVLRSNIETATTNNQVILPNNSAYYFKGSITAGVTGAGNSAMWSFEGGIKRGANAASTVLVGTPVLNLVARDAGASTWIVALTADTTNGGLTVTVTGQAATTIRWVAKVETTEMTY